MSRSNHLDISKALEGIEKSISGSKFEELKIDVFDLILEQRLRIFIEGGSPPGSWPKTKKPKSDGHLTLNDEGTLRNSFGIDGATGQEEVFSEFEVGVRTHVEYAKIHNEGGVIKHPGTISHPGTNNGFGRGIKIPPYEIEVPAYDIEIPQRNFSDFSEEDLEEINEVILDFFENEMSNE